LPGSSITASRQALRGSMRMTASTRLMPWPWSSSTFTCTMVAYGLNAAPLPLPRHSSLSPMLQLSTTSLGLALPQRNRSDTRFTPATVCTCAPPRPGQRFSE
jgi:hypothetical protein